VQVCQELDVPVKLQPPKLSAIDSWQGAFISSTSRLLLPAGEVLFEEPSGHMHSKVSDLRLHGTCNQDLVLLLQRFCQTANQYVFASGISKAKQKMCAMIR
jgi:hypothetical protein